MKKVNILFLIGILFTAITFTSCDKIADEVQDSIEVTINTDLEAPFIAKPVTEKANADGGYEFREIIIIDPSQNPDLSDYMEKIQSVEVTGINILVTSISTTSLVLNNAIFTLTDNVNGSEFVYSTPVNNAISVGTSFHIGDTDPNWAAVNQMISDMHSTTLTARGSFNEDNFEVGFVYAISVKVVAKP